MNVSSAIAVAMVVVGVFSAPTAQARPKVVTQIAVNKDFQDFDLIWGSRKTSYRGKILITTINGIIHVCGVGAYTDAQYRSASDAVLKKYRVLMNGTEIIKDFRFFAKAKTRKRVVTTPANCASTGAKLPKRNPSFTLTAGRGQYRID